MYRTAFLLVVAAILCPVGTAQSDRDVVIREWDVPTAQARPHDPAVAPDGSLWYTGQEANNLGRLDPKTGQIKEFPLETPKSGPHGLVADKAGNIWFTANSAAYIGRLDPKTGVVRECPMPDPAAGHPRTASFDRDGPLLQIVRPGHRVARLDPKLRQNSAVTLQKEPTPNARRYGIVTRTDGLRYFAIVRVHKLGRIEPRTLAVKDYTLPEGARD